MSAGTIGAAPGDGRDASPGVSTKENGAARGVATNAASTGVLIDRKELKALARRSNAPGLAYLAVWTVAMLLTGYFVWFTLGTVWIWPSMFVYGVVLTVPTYSLSHETAHGTAFRTRGLNEAVFWLSSLLYGEEPLHRRYTHTNHHTYTWHVGLDSQMPFDTPLDFRGWLYDVSGLSILKFQFRVLWQLGTRRYTKLMREVAPEAELPKMTRNARIFSIVYLGVAGLIAAGFTWPLWFYVLPRLIGGPIMLMFNIIQHAEMQENSPSIIESTRTFRTDLVGRFLYLNMNNHVEHHLYPQVPFFSLPKLHEAVADQTPRPDPGFWRTNLDLLRVVIRRSLGRNTKACVDPAGAAHGDRRRLRPDREGDDAVKRKRIYTYGGRPAERNLTVADLIALKGTFPALPDLPGERGGGGGLRGGRDRRAQHLRRRSSRGAGRGADHVHDRGSADDRPPHAGRHPARRGHGGGSGCGRGLHAPASLRMVEMLANEGLAVQGHLGLVPRLRRKEAAFGSSARPPRKPSSLRRTSGGSKTPAPLPPRSNAWRPRPSRRSVPARSSSPTRSARAPRATSSSCSSWTSAASPNSPPGTRRRSPTCGPCARGSATSAAEPSARTDPRSWTAATRTPPRPSRCRRTSTRSCSRRSRRAGSSADKEDHDGRVGSRLCL